MTKIKDTSYLYLKFPDLVLKRSNPQGCPYQGFDQHGYSRNSANRGEGEPDITAEDSLFSV